MTTKILCFAGSTREQSINKKLAQLAMHIAKNEVISTDYIVLNDFPLPLYDGDLEMHTFPDKALALQKLLKGYDCKRLNFIIFCWGRSSSPQSWNLPLCYLDTT